MQPLPAKRARVGTSARSSSQGPSTSNAMVHTGHMNVLRGRSQSYDREGDRIRGRCSHGVNVAIECPRGQAS